MQNSHIVTKFRQHLSEGHSVRKAVVLTALATDSTIDHVVRCVFEAKKKAMKDDPCWDGYEMVGMKEKDGKEVPNCVPESAEPDSKKPDEDEDGIPDWADRNPKRKAPAFIDRKKAD